MEMRVGFLILISLALAWVAECIPSDQTMQALGIAHLVREDADRCDGLVGDCVADEEEMMMDSDISHRVLAYRGRWISYGALKRNTVPCNRRGASYYNCQRSGRVNPYRRGCSVITRCKRITS